MGSNGNVSAASDSTGVCEKIFSVITVTPAFRKIRQIASVSPARSDPLNLPANSHVNAVKIVDVQISLPQPKKSAPKVVQIPITSEKTVLPPAAAAALTVHAQRITKVAKVCQGHHDQGSPKHKAELLTQPRKATEEKQKPSEAQPNKATYSKAEEQEKQKPKHSESPLKGAVGEALYNHDAAVKVHEAEAPQVKNEGKKPGGLDINDTFSEYINQAKIKIRTMSSNNISESDDDAKKKESVKDHFSDYIHRAKNKFKSTPSNLGAGKSASFKRE
ncbi:hypothetical protein L3X38_045210 [Prunus dulcis]|uniref:Uncharacterized protein n=1 Tax=Prunus dulcis TaxID=3755 RepID=A0AAD4V040_PRUDU|nr:hypothetical protein L3X38_045210 [Prunus dulcis]